MSHTDQDLYAGDGVAPGLNPADSSPADHDKGAAPGFLEVALAAVEGGEDTPASAESGPDPAEADPGSDTAPDAKDGQAEESDLTEAEKAALPERTRRRIEQLLDDRRTSRAEAEAARAEVETLRGDAERFQSISEFMRENSVSSQDAAQALEIAGLIQTDPEAALRHLQGLVTALSQKVGAVLPSDLEEDVRYGRITQERANELARTRARAQSQEDLAARERERAQQVAQEQREARERDAKIAHVKALAVIGNEIAAKAAQSDPDWKLKEPLVAERLRAHFQVHGVPEDGNAFRGVFNGIVKDVTGLLRQLAPERKAPVTPAPSSSSPRQTLPPPKNAIEAALRALD